MNLLAGGDVLVDAAAVAGLGLWAWDGGAHLWMPGGVGEGGPVGGRGRARRGGDERGRLAGDRGREGRARGGAGGGGGGKGVGGGVRIHVGDRGGWAVGASSINHCRNSATNSFLQIADVTCKGADLTAGLSGRPSQ